MTAKENIEKIVRDSIKPYKEKKRKVSELSTDIEVSEKRHSKQKIVIRSFDNKKIVYFIFFVYIILGLMFIVR
jgi:RNA:NAD 2'-phosphotransferase (TPT1/KptA family)